LAKGAALLSALLTVAMIVTSLLTSACTEDPDQPEADIPGDYEFDLAYAGMGVLIVKISAKDGVLWAQSDASAEPVPLEPVAGEEDEYSVSEPDEGTYEIGFLRDEDGRYSRAHLRNEQLGLDVIGNRLAKSVSFPTLRERLMSRDGLTETRDDLSGVRVAVYFDHGMDGHSALALGRAFQWMGCDVEIVDAADIKRDRLHGFTVLAFPGGLNDPDPWGDLGLNGKSIVQQFIRDGGGYVGSCLGALFASDTADFWGAPLAVDELYLDIFSGKAHCGQEDIAPQGSWPLMTDLIISDHAHPITGTLPERMRVVMYPNGPYFQPYQDTQATIVATYRVTGNPAMVAFEYGDGRVFLSGPHP
jgi:glutamine amidotransferase-like uncharacterized protein